MSSIAYDALLGGPMPSRDLASVELWDRSLTRSRQRRRLSEMARPTRRRRKSISLAVSATLAATPMAPAGVAAAEGGNAVPGVGNTTGDASGHAAARILLRYGSEGRLVAAAQERLDQVLPLTHLAVDGIFGPKTRAAVRDFERRNDMKPTGAIDVRMWAALFRAPVLVLSSSVASSDATATSSSSPPNHFVSTSTQAGSTATDAVSHSAPATARATSHAGTSHTGSGGGLADQNAADTGQAGTGSAGAGAAGSGAGPVTVVTPTNPTATTSTYVLIDGVALPLPRQYLVNGSVDQGVDYAAPGGTPEYAMGDGVIIGEGISGFGPNAPILKITSGPLKGLIVYYGHAGSDLVRVGQHVKAGQQITEVGYGIVGISTGPHLEVGFYPPGGTGAGSKMLQVINRMLAEHPTGRAWGSRKRSARRTSSAARTRRTTSVTSAATRPETARARTSSSSTTSSSGGSSPGGSRSSNQPAQGSQPTSSSQPTTTTQPTQTSQPAQPAPTTTQAAPVTTTQAAVPPTTQAPPPTTTQPAPVVTTQAAPTTTTQAAPPTTTQPAPPTTTQAAPTTTAQPTPTTQAAPAPTSTPPVQPTTTTAVAPTAPATTSTPPPATTTAQTTSTTTPAPATTTTPASTPTPTTAQATATTTATTPTAPTGYAGQ